MRATVEPSLPVRQAGSLVELAFRPLRDALPEHLEWRDDGCEVSPHCLECPLPRCRYDEPGGLRGLLNESRNAEVLRARAGGYTVEEIATRFGISRRSVFRILRHARSASGTGSAGQNTARRRDR